MLGHMKVSVLFAMSAISSRWSRVVPSTCGAHGPKQNEWTIFDREACGGGEMSLFHCYRGANREGRRCCFWRNHIWARFNGFSKGWWHVKNFDSLNLDDLDDTAPTKYGFDFSDEDDDELADLEEFLMTAISWSRCLYLLWDTSERKWISS